MELNKFQYTCTLGAKHFWTAKTSRHCCLMPQKLVHSLINCRKHAHHVWIG